MQQISHLQDKDILTDMLNEEKKMISLYNTAITESNCPAMRRVLQDNLTHSYQDQYGIFDNMATRGYYPVPPADAQALQQAKQTYSNYQNTF